MYGKVREQAEDVLATEYTEKKSDLLRVLCDLCGRVSGVNYEDCARHRFDHFNDQG